MSTRPGSCRGEPGPASPSAGFVARSGSGPHNSALMAPSGSVDSATNVRVARHLRDVRYEIRGPLARRAQELEREGYEIIKLNIGNPALFGFRTPETMRR